MNDTSKTCMTTEYTQNQWLQMEGGLKPHYSSLKTFITKQNKHSWLLYVLELVNQNDSTKFQDTNNFIHVDEKRFYLMRDRQQFLFADEEIPSQGCVCHKGHTTKVVFLCAVAFLDTIPP